MILALLPAAFAADLTLSVQLPGARSPTTIVFHEVQPGRQPTVELPTVSGSAWRLGLAMLPTPAGARVGLQLERSTTLPSGAIRVSGGETHTLDVSMNNRVSVVSGRAVPTRGEDGSWTYVDQTAQLELSLDDGAIPSVVIPGDSRLDLRLSGWDQPTAHVSVMAPIEGAQPTFELPTGPRSVRRLALSVAPADAGHNFAFQITDATRRGRRLILGAATQPVLRALDNEPAAFAYGADPSVDGQGERTHALSVGLTWVQPEAEAN